MIKKCFVITMFGNPFEWIQQYIDNAQKLKESGWYWKIFTPNKIESKGNVEIVPMTIEQYDDLVEKKLGVRPTLFALPSGIPSSHITDFYIFSGIVFEDYLKDFDFWGITNLDVVYGRLDHFLPDSYLKNCDVFTDDVNTVNGVFSLWRNTEIVNSLFRHIGNWKEMISQSPCDGCRTGEKSRHLLYGSDEISMTNVMKEVAQRGIVRYKYPEFYPMLSHDRLEQHVPIPKLEIKEDGSLWELFTDIFFDSSYIHHRPVIGKEIIYFHFGMTKKWPL